jgi:glyoxylase-like metal-dependent hydrolase (beta-lactamase superfamily II)
MLVSRRTFVAAPALVAAGSLAPSPVQASGAAPAQAPATAAPSAGPASQQAPGFYRYKVGDMELTALHDGWAPRNLEGFIRNAELSDVRKAAEEAFLPASVIENSFTPLLVRSGGKTIMLDTGNGDAGAPTTGTTRANLRAAGFDPARVDIVVISHFHGDHINGLRLRDGTAVYPNAEVMVPAGEWAFWMDDARMNQAPDAMKPAFQNVRRVFGPMAKDVKPFEWNKEVAPGITAVDASGHSPGHTAFVLQSAGKSLTHVVDAINHPAFFVRHPDWSPGFDMDADKARTTRRRLLDMAAAERMQLAFYHAPFPGIGHVRKDGNGFAFVPTPWSPVL